MKMKKTISMLLLTLCICLFNSHTWANEEYEKILLKAIPYGWKFGETTCKQLADKLPPYYYTHDGEKIFLSNSYGSKHRIRVICNGEGFKNKFSNIIFYTDRSFHKMKLTTSMRESDVRKVLSQYFKDSELGSNLNIVLSNDMVVEFSFYNPDDDDDDTLYRVFFRKEGSEF
jgi:hypothetical protein